MNKKLTFISVSIIALLISIVSFNIEYAQANVSRIYNLISSNLGFLFLLLNLASFIFAIWLMFSKYGSIKLGGKFALPEYSNLSWVAMMFTTSCSAGLLTLVFTESVIYSYQSVPWGAVPGSEYSHRVSLMYGFHHWGLAQWSMFVPVSALAGYMYYNLNHKDTRISSICNLRNPVSSTIIDTIAILGTVIAPVTSMGMGMPLLTTLVKNLFNIPDQYSSILQYLILFLWICILMCSVYTGLKKGIKNLSNINIILFFILISIFIILSTGTFFKSFFGTLGYYTLNLPKLMTYTGDLDNNNFVCDWTIWYWAWALVFIPMMGIFNAKISKGRTLRQLVLGQLLFSSLSCWIAISSIGSYGLNIGEYLSDVILSDGQPTAVLSILNSLPAPKLMILLVTILCFVFLATTVDSSSFVAAELTKKNYTQDAPRYSRIFWAIISCLITIVLLSVGGFSAMQTLVLIIGVPLILVSVVIMLSFIKVVKNTYDEKRESEF